MKNIKQFLIWHWRKFKFDCGTGIILSGVGGISGIVIAKYSLQIGGWIVLLSLITSCLITLKIIVWDSVRCSYREFKEDQRKTFTAIKNDPQNRRI